ncbi:unnamed protein product [Coregonus sp. 'balchen']|nr:unnamed protein product [Coregonus sp. 'balchen']
MPLLSFIICLHCFSCTAPSLSCCISSSSRSIRAFSPSSCCSHQGLHRETRAPTAPPFTRFLNLLLLAAQQVPQCHLRESIDIQPREPVSQTQLLTVFNPLIHVSNICNHHLRR